jgi:cytochrome c peroxidase
MNHRSKLVAAACLVSAAACHRGTDTEAKRLVAFTAPAGAANRERAELGRRLFFDHRLSGDRSMSCATCHDPAKGFADGLAKARGKGGRSLERNTPSVVNVDARAPYFWDGRTPTAEEQASQPLTNPREMDRDLGELCGELGGIPEYVARFQRSFGSPDITGDRVGAAIAEFERTLVSADAPLDRYLLGETTALSRAAIRGLELFRGRARCIRCHDGPHLTDGSFHNIGIGDLDVGRFGILQLPSMQGAFKTPSLRDVALTAPYFHDGSAATLKDVVAHYVRGGASKVNLDADIVPLSLSAADQDALVAFMQSLTGGRSPPVDAPRVPRIPTQPLFRTLRDLMKSTNGMLHELDDMIVGIDEGNWSAVRESVATLIEGAEELEALQMKHIQPARQGKLKTLVGDLIIGFEELDAAARRRDRAAAATVYEQVRDRCDSCHEEFRIELRKARSG